MFVFMFIIIFYDFQVLYLCIFTCHIFFSNSCIFRLLLSLLLQYEHFMIIFIVNFDENDFVAFLLKIKNNIKKPHQHLKICIIANIIILLNLCERLMSFWRKYDISLFVRFYDCFIHRQIYHSHQSHMIL